MYLVEFEPRPWEQLPGNSPINLALLMSDCCDFITNQLLNGFGFNICC